MPGSTTSTSPKIPRPSNCFILFRREKVKELKGEHMESASVKIGKMWKEANEDERLVYKAKASVVAKEHKKKYPDYRYQPVKKSEKKSKKSKRGVGSESSDGSSSTRSTPLNSPYSIPRRLSDNANATGQSSPASSPLASSVGSPQSLYTTLLGDPPRSALPSPSSEVVRPVFFPFPGGMMMPPGAQSYGIHKDAAIRTSPVPMPNVNYAQWPPIPTSFGVSQAPASQTPVPQRSARQVPVQQVVFPAAAPQMPRVPTGILPPVQQQGFYENYGFTKVRSHLNEQERVHAPEMAFHNSSYHSASDGLRLGNDAFLEDNFPYNEYLNDFPDTY